MISFGLKKPFVFNFSNNVTLPYGFAKYSRDSFFFLFFFVSAAAVAAAVASPPTKEAADPVNEEDAPGSELDSGSGGLPEPFLLGDQFSPLTPDSAN